MIIFYILRKSITLISLKYKASVNFKAESDIYKIIELKMKAENENVKKIKNALSIKLFCKKLF